MNVMVIVDCPMCLGPVALADEDAELRCDECSMHVEIVSDDVPLVTTRAA
jgi:hypothetical protein